MRGDARVIWSAAIAAVVPETLVATRLAIQSDGCLACDTAPLEPLLRLDACGRIVVVGGGKAAAGLAAGVAACLGPERGRRHRLAGLVSVPEGCGRDLGPIEVRETRPQGSNLPTAAAVQATDEMLALVSGLSADDLAIAVVTGGGSALLATVREGVTLEEKVAVTRRLSAAGATIAELNTVRRAASGVKAGGLARRCRAGRLLVLVISDVIGDALETIASGPCMPRPADPAAAVAILERFAATAAAPRLTALLRAEGAETTAGSMGDIAASWITPQGCRVDHLVVGSNRTAVDAAAAAARTLGYETRVRHARPAGETEADADTIGRRLAEEGRSLVAEARRAGRPLAVVEGGEATVVLPDDAGTGGRNQQTVLAAVAAVGAGWPDGLLVASVGTDGEDGPTIAAGGIADAAVAARLAVDPAALERGCHRRDATPLLTAADGLVVTGPTGTNVADVRIVLARP